MSFGGFSEDDIRKLAKTQDTNKIQKGLNKNHMKKVTFKNNSTSSISKTKNTHVNSNKTVRSSQELPDDAKLSIPDKNEKPEKVNDDTSQLAQPTSQEMSSKEESEVVKAVVKQEKKFKNLDEFEARQKLIEEQNRKRKELLAKALADRTKQTQEEAQRLQEIQEEFKKLDAILSSDVKILRKQIEEASIDYMECQKRYQKIEKEFLEVKILLHQKLEKKEMLTEHLCTIIEKNEERKAEKLNELLQKLQVNSSLSVNDVNTNNGKA